MQILQEKILICFVVIEKMCFSAEGALVNNSWVIDTGVSCHMIGERSLYSSMQPLVEPITGKFTVSFVFANGETTKLFDVLYVSKIRRNLLSVASIIDHGHEVKFTKTQVEILNSNGKVIGKEERRNYIYELNALTATTSVVSTSRLV